MSAGRRIKLCLLSAVVLAAALTVQPGAALADQPPRIDLRVLVITDGGTSVSAVQDRLRTEGVPFRTVDLRDSGRPAINEAFLSGTTGGAPHARYQAVVLPGPYALTDPAEATALADYERRFGIRRLNAYVYPSSVVGLHPPGYVGTLDGASAQVTEAGRDTAFRYLRGPVQFEDNSPDVGESYGYLASPLPDDPAAGRSFKPFITGTAQGTTGVLAGVHEHDGRSEMVLTFSANSAQWQFRTIGHGLITWLTKGVHLGHDRNYFAVHIDDVFMADSRWSTEHNCTPGSDCPAGITTPGIRMLPKDVLYAVAWQLANGFTLDMAFNGLGSDEVVEQRGKDPLTTAFLLARSRFRWLNHTYGHPYLGCEQDFSVSPWQCAKDPATGETRYMSQAEIEDQITRNLAWAKRRGIRLDPSELVTGEHSGLRISPQQPADNPGLAPALNATGVTSIAADASREKDQRPVGDARTLPRYPLSVFYNVGTEREEVDEYNWIYTSRSAGGSGLCEDLPLVMTCIEPLDLDTGYRSYIVPTDARITLSHIVDNDPRAHYAHQSNLAEDRIIYPLLGNVLRRYRATFAGNAPVVNAPQAELGAELGRQQAWRAALADGAFEDGRVSAYQQGGTVHVQAPAGLEAPITMPAGTREGTAPFGRAYAGERSAYRAGTVTLSPPGT